MSKHSTTKKVVYKGLGFMGYPDYQVGDDGSIWSFKHNKNGSRLNFKPLPSGYSQVALCNKGKYKFFYIHRLVLEAFVGPCPEGMEACHKDGDRGNNSLKNLRWDTRLNNHADRREHGTLPQGEKNQGAKIKKEDVVRMRELRRTQGYSIKMLMKIFKLSQGQVCKIVNGTSWSHIKT